jgi:hypothetical protein
MYVSMVDSKLVEGSYSNYIEEINRGCVSMRVDFEPAFYACRTSINFCDRYIMPVHAYLDAEVGCEIRAYVGPGSKCGKVKAEGAYRNAILLSCIFAMRLMLFPILLLAFL